jgi:UDP-glucose 4-epimerase
MGKTILFGGSGFLGNVFLREHPEIISVGRTPLPDNLTNIHLHVPSMDRLDMIDELDIDNVIFLIGNSNHHEIDNSPIMGIEYNVIPLKKALAYFSKRKIKKFVCFTTILLYGNKPKDRPVHEMDVTYPYQTEYIFSKHLAEEVVEFYSMKVPIINVRLCNIYGDTSLIRPDLVPTLIHDVLTKDNPTVWNTDPQRDFIFTSDAADAVMKLLETDYEGNVNIGSGKMTSVADIVEIIEDISGKKIQNLNRPVSGVMKFVADISLLTKLTGWRPKYTLREGISKTYQVMKNNLKE